MKKIFESNQKRVTSGIIAIVFALSVVLSNGFGLQLQASAATTPPTHGNDYLPSKKAIYSEELGNPLTNSYKSFYFGEYDHYTGYGQSAPSGYALNQGTPEPMLWDFKGYDSNGQTNVALSRYAVKGEMYFNGAYISSSDGLVYQSFTTNTYAGSQIQTWLSGSWIYDAYYNKIAKFNSTSSNPDPNGSSTFSDAEYNNALKGTTITTNGSSIANQKIFLPWASLNNNDTAVYWGTNDTDTSTKIGTGTGWSTTLSTGLIAKAANGSVINLPESGDVVARGTDGKGSPYPNIPLNGALSYMTRSKGTTSGANQYALGVLVPDSKTYAVSAGGQSYYRNGYGVRPELSLDVSNIVYIDKIKSTSGGFLTGEGWSTDPGLGSSDVDNANYRLVVFDSEVQNPTAPSTFTNTTIAPGTSNITIPGWSNVGSNSLAYKIIDANTGLMINTGSLSDVEYAAGKMGAGSTTLNVDTSKLPAGNYQLVVWAQQPGIGNKSDEASNTAVVSIIVVNTPTATPSASPTRSPSPSPSASPTKSPSPTPTATNGPTATPTKSPTPTPTATGGPTNTPTRTPSPTPSPTKTPSPSPSPTKPGTPTKTPSPTPSKTPTPTVTPIPPDHAITTLYPGKTKPVSVVFSQLHPGYTFTYPNALITTIGYNQPYAGIYTDPVTGKQTSTTIYVDVIPEGQTNTVITPPYAKPVSEVTPPPNFQFKNPNDVVIVVGQNGPYAGIYTDPNTGKQYDTVIWVNATTPATPTPSASATPSPSPVPTDHTITTLRDGHTKPLSSVPPSPNFKFKNPNDVITHTGYNQPFDGIYNDPVTGVQSPTTIYVDVIPEGETTTTIIPGSPKPVSSVTPPPNFKFKNPNDVVTNVGENGPYNAIYTDPNTGVQYDTVIWVNATPTLIKDDHFAYMWGYPGGYFNPEGAMTRAEVAVMFARLMLENGSIPQAKGIFPDVPKNAWYANAVEYLASNGIMKGRDSTWFDPNTPITRAEFAAVAVRFDNLASAGQKFSDVPSSYWAYDAINSAAAAGWITGYGDGTFHPMDNIKRVEVVTIVNRMTNRQFDPTFDQSLLVKYTDVASNYWGYGDIEEASNGHDHTITNGIEKWTNLNDFGVKW